MGRGVGEGRSAPHILAKNSKIITSLSEVTKVTLLSSSEKK